MCHPDLMRGLCCICFGTIAEENRHPDYSDLHRGKCAILAGEYPTNTIAFEAEDLITRMHAEEPLSQGRNRIMREYFAWVDSVATEDYYDMSGPE